MAIKLGTTHTIHFTIIEADLIGNLGYELNCPVDGYIREIGGIIQKAVTTGGTVTVKTGAALATTVLGLGFTVADAATKGTRYVDVATAGSTTRVVAKGDRIAITTASFATAGGLHGYLTIDSADGVY